MATATLPQRRGIGRGVWLAAGVALIAIMIGAALLLARRGAGASAAVATTTVGSGGIVASVDGSGTVAAAQSLDMPFQTGGTVTQVLAKEGDLVKAGQVLARLDDRDLQLQVASAQASLDSANAALAQARQGNATEQDIAAQQAAVHNAQANLDKARTNNITAADIAKDQAALRSALADLDALRNPSGANLSAAQLKVQQAQADLQSTRDNDSKAKTQAEIQLHQTSDALTKAQASYATAKQNWEFVQETGADPTNPTTTDASGKTRTNKLNEVQQRQYYETFVQAEAALRSAEKDVQIAQLNYDNARQSEVTNIQSKEAALADAQRQLDALKRPSASDIAKAQASVDQARAQLQKDQQGGTKADIAAAQANLDQSKANLAKLTAPATATDLQVKQASVAQAEQSLKQAQLKLEQATLKAPFDGVVTDVAVVPGSVVSGGAAAVSLIDRSTLHVDLKLSENDVAKVALGQQVALTIDALKDWKAQGTVSYIAPSAESSNGVVTYAVRVSFPDSDARVKVGMTANLSITTAKKEGVLLVPNSALLPKGAGHAVQVLGVDGTTSELEVQTGLSDGTNTEITGGLRAGDKVVTNPNASSAPASRGPFGG
jgi:HlyD family secretion protein